MSESLQPCPFCGANVDEECIVDMGSDGFWVACPVCDASGPGDVSPEAAIAGWNDCRLSPDDFGIFVIYREALASIAAYDDEGAEEHLKETGSYEMFTEPNAVKAAREALNGRGCNVSYRCAAHAVGRYVFRLGCHECNEPASHLILL